MPTAYQKLIWILFGKSLATRLAEACAAVKDVKKLGDNGQFRYLRIVDIAEELRDQLFSRGILIIPSDVEINTEMFVSDAGERPITEIRVRSTFTVTDGRETLTFSAFGVGRDQDGKALFAAQTGALKSWLKRLGLIFGERDDPEVGAREPDELPRQQLAQQRYQARAWSAALATCGRTESEIEAILSEAIGQELTSADIIALDRTGFDVAMKILTQHSDLTEVLEKSKQAAKAKRNGKQGRPQTIVEALDRSALDEMTGD